MAVTEGGSPALGQDDVVENSTSAAASPVDQQGQPELTGAGAEEGAQTEGAAVSVPPEAAGEPKAVAGRVRRVKKRPCFHCGAMTNVEVLEKTGELCWRCYRPIGFVIIKNLAVLAVILAVAAGTVIAWRVYFAGSSPATAKTENTEQQEIKEFSTEQKLAILRRHLLDRESITDLCQEFGISPAEVRRWRDQFFESAEAAFERNQEREPNAVERRIQTIEQKLQMASKVLGELRENLVQLKKESGQYESSATQRYILDSAGPPPKEK